jgi:hypothetical protein
MMVQALTFLQVNTFFYEGINLGNIACADPYWQAKLTQYAD